MTAETREPRVLWTGDDGRVEYDGEEVWYVDSDGLTWDVAGWAPSGVPDEVMIGLVKALDATRADLQAMTAALDQAVSAHVICESSLVVTKAERDATRREAIEECAGLADEWSNECAHLAPEEVALNIAEDIRHLLSAPPTPAAPTDREETK